MSKAPMIMSAGVASPIDLNEFARRAALKMAEHDFHGFEPVVLAVVEEMLTVGDGQKVEDERAAFEADFICRWKAQNPKTFEGAVDVQASVFEMLLKRRADGEYENLVPREAWFSWQSSANRLARTEPEAPLVVAWLSWVPGYDGNNDSRQTHFTEKQARSRIEFISPFLDGVDEARADALMTVAQHERIVAALSARPEQPLRMPIDELQAVLAEAEGVRDLSDQAEQLIPWIADAPSRSEAAIVAIRDLWDEDECPSYPVVAHALRELLTTTPIDQPERK